MNLYYKMLRRQYKKRRNKKGGRNFFDAVSKGAEQWKSAAETAKNKGMEAAANTQQGFADFEASRKANVQRSMMAGEYSDLAKSLMKKKIEANPLGLAKQKQLAANLRDDPLVQRMIENRTPNLSPMKPSRKLRRFNPKEGGKRKSRRRKKSKKRKTRKRSAGMYSVTERNRLKNLEKNIPLNLLVQARNMSPKQKLAEFKKIGINKKDLQGMAQMRQEQAIENKALRAHKEMMRMEMQKKQQSVQAGGKKKTRRRKKRKTRRKRRR